MWCHHLSPPPVVMLQALYEAFKQGDRAKMEEVRRSRRGGRCGPVCGRMEKWEQVIMGCAAATRGGDGLTHSLTHGLAGVVV